MKTKMMIIAVALFLLNLPLSAQWVVTDPTNFAQSIVNTTRNVIQTTSTAKNMVKNFEETVKIYKQGKEYYDRLKSVHDLVKDAKKVHKTVLLFGEISDIYVTNYQKMLVDPNYSVDELSAIAFGYTAILEESTDMLQELKDVVNVNGLSMTDKERMDIIERVHNSIRNQRDLISYYTRKNISVSYLRSKKAGDTERIISLYGTAEERYW